jgi:stage V sporulation protein G
MLLRFALRYPHHRQASCVVARSHMKITDVRIYPADEEEVMGYASITLDRCFIVRHFKIIRNDSGGLYVTMPSRKQTDGICREIAYPITAEMRGMIEEAILTKYRNILNDGEIQPAPDAENRHPMIEHKGYFISGTALMIHPKSPDWHALGTVCSKTPEGLIIRFERVGDAIFITKGAAETHGLVLCREWIEEKIRLGQAAEENRWNPA